MKILKIGIFNPTSFFSEEVKSGRAHNLTKQPS